MPNQFAAVTDVRELIFQAVGAGSMCWENVGAAGIFDSDRACTVAEDVVERMVVLLGFHSFQRVPAPSIHNGEDTDHDADERRSAEAGSNFHSDPHDRSVDGTLGPTRDDLRPT